jgi:hypothetical protein
VQELGVEPAKVIPPPVPLLHRKRGGRGIGKKQKRLYKIPSECRLSESDRTLFEAQIYTDFGKDMGELMKGYTKTLPEYFDLLIMDPPWHCTSQPGKQGVLLDWDKVTFFLYTLVYCAPTILPITF